MGFAKTFAEIFRDFTTDGVPSSGRFSPHKSDIRQWGATVEAGVNGVVDVFLIAVSQSNGVGNPGAASGPAVPSGGLIQQFYSNTLSAANDPVGPANTGSAWPAFGLSYYYATGRRICFVPMASNGSCVQPSLDATNNWDPDNGVLFAPSNAAVTAAMAAINNTGLTPVFRGILSVLGETDAASPTGYQAALEHVIAAYRIIYGATMPFYIFRTGALTAAAGGDTAGFQAIRAAQEAVALADPYSHIVFYNAVDFPDRGLMVADPGVHYMQAGLDEMGRIGAANIIAASQTGGDLKLSKTSIISFGGKLFAQRGTAWNILNDVSGGNAIFLGGTADKQNIFQNDTNRFRLRDGTNIGFFDSSGLTASEIRALISLDVLSSTAAHYLKIVTTRAFTADRNLNIDIGDANRSLVLGGDAQFLSSFLLSGGFGLTVTTTGVSSIIAPTAGTLATLAGAEALSNKTVNGLHINTTTGTLAVGNGKTLTLSNSLTLAGTDGASIAFGAGGTVAYTSQLKSALVFYSNGTVAAATTTYMNSSAQGGAEDVISQPIPFSATIKNLRVKTNSAPVGTETFTYTLMVNGVAQALTCVVTGVAVTGSDTNGAHAVTVAAGDTYSLRLVTSTLAASAYHTAAVELDPS